MKNLSGMYHKLLTIMALSLAIGLAGTQASAYVLDTKIGEANLANSGAATELAALQSILDALGIPSSSLSLDLKLDQENTSFNVSADPSTLGQWYIDVAPKAPGYFLLKFGTGSTSATADTFFFRNIDDLGKLVFSDAQVQNLSGGNCGVTGKGKPKPCNIERLSHYSTFNNSDNPPTVLVPEPASLLLLGAGLLGLGFARRKSNRS